MATKSFARLGFVTYLGESLAQRPALLWLLIAFAVRLLAGMVLHLYSEFIGFEGFYPLASGGDDLTSWNQAQSLLAGITPERIFSPYPYVLMGLFSVFGPNLLLGKLLSVVAGSLVVYVGVHIARELTAPRQYEWRDLRHPVNLAGFFLTFYPSAIFHSTQLMRDSLIVLFGVLSLYCALRLIGGKEGFFTWFGYGLALILLYEFRPYAGFVLVFSFPLYLIFTRHRAAEVLFSLLCAALVPWFAGFGIFDWRSISALLNPSTVPNVATFREEVYAIGGSAIGVTVDFTSFFGFLWTYAYSYLTAMFGPFLWQIRSQVVAMGLLESLPMLLLVPLWAQGIWRLLGRKESKAGFLLLFSLLLIAAIALFSANIGANVRLRLLPWTAFLIYAAVRLGEKSLAGDSYAAEQQEMPPSLSKETKILF